MPILKQPPPDPLATVGAALDQISWTWVCDNFPDLADALMDAVTDGRASAEIRRFVMGHTGRYELALRCEQAARHLESEA